VRKNSDPRSLWCLPLVVILPLVLCSCGVYEAATTRDEEDQENITVAVAMNPIVAIAGTDAIKEPSEQDRQKYLLDYARAIRNRKIGKISPENARFTILAMNYAYPLASVMTEKEVVELFGPPDERSVRDGRVRYVYRIKGLREHDEPSLYLNLR